MVLADAGGRSLEAEGGRAEAKNDMGGGSDFGLGTQYAE